MAPPGGDRRLAVTLPALPCAGGGTRRNEAFVVDEPGDDMLVLRLQNGDGRTHRIVVGPAAIGDGHVDLISVFDELGEDPDDHTLAIGTAATGPATPTSVGNWDLASREAPPR